MKTILLIPLLFISLSTPAHADIDRGCASVSRTHNTATTAGSRISCAINLALLLLPVAGLMVISRRRKDPTSPQKKEEQ